MNGTRNWAMMCRCPGEWAMSPGANPHIPPATAAETFEETSRRDKT